MDFHPFRFRWTTLALTIVVLAMVFGATRVVTAQSGESSDQSAIRSQLKRWRDLFSRTGEGKRYSLEGYEDLYLEEMLTFDSYVPDWATTQIDGFENYRAIWERDVNDSFPNWTIQQMDVLSVEMAESGELAWSALNFWGEGVRANGERYQGSQHGTHVWRKVDGTWKIVHEHLTAPIRVRGVANAPIDGEEDTRPRLP